MSLKTLQNFYKQTVSQTWETGTGTRYVSVKPTPSEGWLVLSPSNTSLREIVYYTSTGTDGTGDYVVLSQRGLGGTSDQTHSINEPIRMNFTAQHQQEISDAMDQIVAGGAQDASISTKGIAKLSVAPVSASNPIAVGDNDTRLSGFGMSDGSDGDVTISSGTTTLTKDMFYNNLTVNGTGILATAGFRVMVKGTLTVDGTSGAKIQHNGGAGGNASGMTAGTGGAAAVAGSLPVGKAGRDGATGRSDLGAGASATAAFNADYAITTTQGATGGTGGAGASQPGGAGGAGGTNTGTIKDIPRTIFPAYYGWETNVNQLRTFQIACGAGGGGAGGGQGGAQSGGGGGGGGSGGYIYIQAKIMSLTGVGCIRANGGNGGNGGNATSNAGGGGGGAGGSGGVVILHYAQKTGTGTAVASGGTKGTYGTGNTNPVVLASDGVDGTVIYITQ
jgi:hypothetical protein